MGGLRGIDMFRKIPADLTSATTTGAILSVAAYDLSPMAVAVRTTGKRWYDFVTSICAIVGGTFTTVGLIDAVAHKVLKAGKQL